MANLTLFLRNRSTQVAGSCPRHSCKLRKGCKKKCRCAEALYRHSQGNHKMTCHSLAGNGKRHVSSVCKWRFLWREWAILTEIAALGERSFQECHEDFQGGRSANPKKGWICAAKIVEKYLESSTNGKPLSTEFFVLTK